MNSRYVGSQRVLYLCLQDPLLVGLASRVVLPVEMGAPRQVEGYRCPSIKSSGTPGVGNDLRVTVATLFSRTLVTLLEKEGLVEFGVEA